MSNVINKTRTNILAAGGSELKAIATNEGIRELWNEKQRLLKEMNLAKKTAADAAALPYLEQIAEIDQEYACLLEMVGENAK